MSTIILGVDPGKTGALSFLDIDRHQLFIADMPVIPVGKSEKRTEVSSHKIFDLLDRYEPSHAFIEDVWSLPTDGHVGAFSFGDAYGTVKGVLGAYGLDFNRVLPNLWKKNLKVPADKNEARQRAMELFPDSEDLFQRVRDDGRAESSMISLFGCFSLGHRPSKTFTLELVGGE